MLDSILTNFFTYWILFLYGVDYAWWIRIQWLGLHNTPEAYYFNGSYAFIAISGACYGLTIAHKKWGGMRSVIGRGLTFLSIGLLSQAVGVLIWWYYNVIAKVEVPYPSWADIGFFGLIPAYTIAALMFAQAAGGKFSLRTIWGKASVAIIPAVTLTLAYGLFLRNIGLDTQHPLKMFLDIGYPLGEIIPVSIALFTLMISRYLLGGTMRKRILFLVVAFFFQFMTEYTFLYAFGTDTYQNGNINDLFYASSYTIMSIAIITFTNYD